MIFPFDRLPFFSQPLRLGLALFLTLLLPTFARAATLNVPSASYPTIQSAVDAAFDGDTVLVADGIYSGPGNRDIDFNRSNITVTSQHGAASTTLDCGGFASTDGSGNHRGFFIQHGEHNATISGFTIKNGYETYIQGITFSGDGGGICIENYNTGTITISNCIVTGNKAGGAGGIYNQIDDVGAIALINCTISGNTAIGGGAIGSSGGGLFNTNYNGGTITLTDCTISGNTALAAGGGMYNHVGSTVYNQVTYNSALTLTGCSISGNKSPGGGSGIYNQNGAGGTITQTNCTLYGNIALGGFGCVNNLNDNGGTISVTNCTITGNTATRDHLASGGGILNDNYLSGTITVTNCILYGDINGEIASQPDSSSDAVVSHCDIQGGSLGAGNINADPLFVNAAGYDLHLQSGSSVKAQEHLRAHLPSTKTVRPAQIHLPSEPMKSSRPSRRPVATFCGRIRVARLPFGTTIAPPVLSRRTLMGHFLAGPPKPSPMAEPMAKRDCFGTTPTARRHCGASRVALEPLRLPTSALTPAGLQTL